MTTTTISATPVSRGAAAGLARHGAANGLFGRLARAWAAHRHLRQERQALARRRAEWAALDPAERAELEIMAANRSYCGAGHASR